MTAWRTRLWRDEGTSAIEAAILAPALLALLALAIVAMRIEVAGEAVESSAHDAARAASISRTASDARTAARTAARTTLGEEGLVCRSLTVSVDTSQFSRPVGQPAAVTATVTCVVSLSDIAIPGLAGSTTLTSTFVSDLDQYRGRALGFTNTEVPLDLNPSGGGSG